MAKNEPSDTSGEQLVKEQVISKADLDEARAREERSGTPWYRQLVQMNKLNFDSVNDLLHYEFHSKESRKSHQSLGKRLVEFKAITEKELEDALKLQSRNGKLLGTILVDEDFVTPDTIAKALSAQYDIPFADLRKTPSKRDALDKVPESMALQKNFIPVKLEGDKLTVLISGPQAPQRLRGAGILLGLRITPLMTAVHDLSAEIKARYGGKKSFLRTSAPPQSSKKASAPKQEKRGKKDKSVKKDKKTKKTPEKEESLVMAPTKSEKKRFENIAQQAQGVPVVSLVSTIIHGAVNSGATDVHLDPSDPEMRVRYRIDGVLHDVMSIPKDIENAVVSRLKILADVDITETRHPQDGHISMDIDDMEFDVRVATLPTYLGERVVLRLLDQSSVLAGISDLGLEEEDQKKLQKALDQPYGMVLVTGPTGSGKTTTLYSCLNEKDVMSDSIVTLEDPVEYQLSGINQVQIDTDIDLSFANVLRASLRQDIDVLLVGEIRDPETARIAIRASMTGHLVFSTLHTNDAPETIATLRNMDIPSYLISSALTSIIAQRLVRKICPECKTHFKPTKTLLKSLKLPETTKRLYRGAGCEHCHHTGALGRIGIFEILEITEPIRKLINANEPPEKITKAAKLKTMADRCRTKVKNGTVTPEEFLRVIRT
jgi:type IV pilus assembly protein PilB